MLTVADMGEGGVKNGWKSADVLYGQPLIQQQNKKIKDIWQAEFGPQNISLTRIETAVTNMGPWGRP